MYIHVWYIYKYISLYPIYMERDDRGDNKYKLIDTYVHIYIHTYNIYIYIYICIYIIYMYT